MSQIDYASKNIKIILNEYLICKIFNICNILKVTKFSTMKLLVSHKSSRFSLYGTNILSTCVMIYPATKYFEMINHHRSTRQFALSSSRISEVEVEQGVNLRQWFLITRTISLEWELVKTSIILMAIYSETRDLINRTRKPLCVCVCVCVCVVIIKRIRN